ncbi:MAG: [protein-PII] uridylyltransferase, partial [Pseudomonadota bacterium]
WVAKRHFGTGHLHELVSHGFITEQEYKTLIEGQALLWQIRFGLHVITRRREDRLLFDHQRTLAAQFGYRDDRRHLAVEQFMKEYYRAVMNLSRLNEKLLQLLQEEILYGSEPAEPVEFNKRFQSRKGFLEVTDEFVFSRYPFAMLEVFLVMAQHPELKGVRANTIRLIRNHRHLIDPGFRDNLAVRSLFMEILRQQHGITHELRRMNRYGVLAAYLPLFGNIVGQMQHDLFHVYTVDEHTLFVVRNLRRFTVRAFSHEFPLCSELMARVPKQELLLIAGLFHDIARGRGGDHSELGARDAIEFCKHHGMSDYDARLVGWLVRAHLLMSTTAQRKDIDDPDVVHAFACEVGDRSRLDYLYLLTVADIRATSPKVWNSWKDSLLKELYYAARRALRRGLGNRIVQSELVAETRAEARKPLLAAGIDDDAVDSLWQTLGEEYFLRYSPSEVVWHTRSILEHGDPDESLVLVRAESGRGGTEVVIYAHESQHLFAQITAALDQIGLTIVDARIITTTDDHAIDTFLVLEEDGQPISEPQRIQEIRDKLDEYLASDKLPEEPVARHVPRQAKHFRFPTRVEFSQDENTRRTIMDVTAYDRPGILSQIGAALVRCNTRVRNAKIATFGERAEDIFYITDSNDQPLSRPEQFEHLTDAITQALGD